MGELTLRAFFTMRPAFVLVFLAAFFLFITLIKRTARAGEERLRQMRMGNDDLLHILI